MTELIEIISSFGFWIYFPILMLIAIPMMRYLLRMGSDDDDDENDEELGSRIVIPRQLNDKKFQKVVRGLYDHDPNIITKKVKIKSDDIAEPILCPNCGVSVMTQWQKCYRCGELL
jgi:predicted RNA-binding Zn-ribbon protein involved in translation (DUF1610 family)